MPSRWSYEGIDHTDRVLLAALRGPWSSPTQIAARVGINTTEARSICEQLGRADLLEPALHRLKHFPPVVYACTNQGLAALSGSLRISTERLLSWAGFEQERWWWLRASFEIAQEVNAFCAALAQNSGPDALVDWQPFILRRFMKRLLIVHCRLALIGPDTVRPYYLLCDRTSAPVTHWLPQLRYLALWARWSTDDYFPPLLVLTASAFRARALLALSQAWAPQLAVAVTSQKRVALSQHPAQARWHMLRDERLIEVRPFDFAAIPLRTWARQRHRIAPAGDLIRKRSRAYTDQSTWHPSSSSHLMRLVSPTREIKAIERLDDEDNRVLTFLARHPVCPTPTIARLCELPIEQTRAILAALRTAGLAQPTSHNQPASTWMATDAAVRVCAVRDGRLPDPTARCYAAYCRERHRRPHHTAAIFSFFEQVKSAASGRSRPIRWPDEPRNRTYYDLTSFEDEMACASFYREADATRMFLPDGGGTFRAGHELTWFWLEIDGTPQSPSRWDPRRLYAKIDNLVGYQHSQRWAYRYPEFPRLLIVTTDPGNYRYLQDGLFDAARARSVQPPEVFATTIASLSTHGPLGRIWFDLSDEGISVGDPRQGTVAFRGADHMPGVVTHAERRRNLLDDLQFAFDAGLVGEGQCR